LYRAGSVSGIEEALAILDGAMDRCLSVALRACSSEELVGYLEAHQQRCGPTAPSYVDNTTASSTTATGKSA
jgi:hypothetical protein